VKIHEYQARELLGAYGVAGSRGEIVSNATEAASAFKRFANPYCVAKVQVLAGGRGKAGGVQIVKTPQAAEEFCRRFIGKDFSTCQSGGKAENVRCVLITEDIKIREEYYLSIAVDRSKNLPIILFSKQGGVDIEETALKNPAAIQRIHFSPNSLPDESRIFSRVATGFSKESIPRQISSIAAKLAKLFVEKDASICEINPLALVSEDRVMALDAKITFDDNALFRHEDIKALKDPEEEDERERKAKEFGLSYVSMEGNVGCLVNGAGLAMATMDMIKLAGGEPANFLDVGGSATADQVREGFKIILQDTRVEAILVNIFGGIMKCDVIAQGVIEASKETRLRVPLVVRLEGTHVEEGRALLKNSGLRIISCSTIEDAADTAVKKAREFKELHVHSR